MAVQPEQNKTLSPLQHLDLASKSLHRLFRESMRQFESVFAIHCLLILFTISFISASKDYYIYFAIFAAKTPIRFPRYGISKSIS